MVRIRLRLAAFLALVAVGLVPADAWSQDGSQQRIIRYAKSRLLVHARPGLSEKDLDKVLTPHGAKRRSHIRQLNVYVVEWPANASEMAIARLLRRNPMLESADIDEAFPPELIPNDSYYANEWHLPRFGGPAAWLVAGKL